MMSFLAALEPFAWVIGALLLSVLSWRFLSRSNTAQDIDKSFERHFGLKVYGEDTPLYTQRVHRIIASIKRRRSWCSSSWTLLPGS